jgi:hypothetical protein
MASFRTIIDDSGLPSAAGYYARFPREPSPAGDMKLESKTTVKLKSITLRAVLDEMAKVDSGGTVLIVCHGVSTGLLIPIAANGVDAVTSTLESIEKADDAEKRAAVVRAMPANTDDEKNAKRDAWVKLVTSVAPGSIVGEVTLQQAEGQYNAWFNLEASKMRITPNDLRAVIASLRKVRGQKLSRVEVRACSAGRVESTLKIMKRFFGCKDFLAPSAETFYLPPIFVQSVGDAVFLEHWVPEAKRQVMMPSTPGGRARPVSLRKLTQQGRKRVFDNKFVLTVWELAPFKYTGGGAGVRLPKPGPIRGMPDPNWPDVKAFVNKRIMPAASYEKGTFPVAGFWIGSGALPFILPNEDEYKKKVVKAK